MSTFIGLVGIGLFCIPLGMFGGGFADKLAGQADPSGVEVLSWQQRDRPNEEGRQTLHNFLYSPQSHDTVCFKVYFWLSVTVLTS